MIWIFLVIAATVVVVVEDVEMSVEGIIWQLSTPRGFALEKTTLFRIHALEPAPTIYPRLNLLALMSAYVCPEIYANAVPAIFRLRLKKLPTDREFFTFIFRQYPPPVRDIFHFSWFADPRPHLRASR